MAPQFIANRNLEPLLERLRRYAELHGPVRGEDGAVRFAALTQDTPPDLFALRTLLPPKKYLLHPRETILTYTAATGYQLPDETVRPLILFGLHPCDLAGINYLDRVFLGADPDPLYAARRSSLTLVGISCTPDQFCSCHHSNSPLKALSDLFLSAAEGGFVVTSGSPRGDELIEGVKEVLEEREVPRPMIPADSLDVPFRNLYVPNAMRRSPSGRNMPIAAWGAVPVRSAVPPVTASMCWSSAGWMGALQSGCVNGITACSSAMAKWRGA